MKIRKILPLLAVAVVALFALASCDQLLESIYPDQTTGLAGNNSVSVQVDVYYQSYGYQTSIYSGPLTVWLYDSSGTVVQTQTTWLSYSTYDPITAYVTFYGLKNGSYYSYAFVDANNNGLNDDGYYNQSTGYSSVQPVSGGSSATEYQYIPYYY